MKFVALLVFALALAALCVRAQDEPTVFPTTFTTINSTMVVNNSTAELSFINHNANNVTWSIVIDRIVDVNTGAVLLWSDLSFVPLIYNPLNPGESETAGIVGEGPDPAPAATLALNAPSVNISNSEGVQGLARGRVIASLVDYGFVLNTEFAEIILNSRPTSVSTGTMVVALLLEWPVVNQTGSLRLQGHIKYNGAGATRQLLEGGVDEVDPELYDLNLGLQVALPSQVLDVDGSNVSFSLGQPPVLPSNAILLQGAPSLKLDYGKMDFNLTIAEISPSTYFYFVVSPIYAGDYAEQEENSPASRVVPSVLMSLASVLYDLF